MVSSVFSRARWKSAGKHIEDWSMMRYRIALNLWTLLSRRGGGRKEVEDDRSKVGEGGAARKYFYRCKNFESIARIPIINETPVSSLPRFPAARPSRKLFNKGANWRLIVGGRNISREQFLFSSQLRSFFLSSFRVVETFFFFFLPLFYRL